MKREDFIMRVVELKELIKNTDNEICRNKMLEELESHRNSLSATESFYFDLIEVEDFEIIKDKLGKVEAMERLDYDYNGKINKWYEE